MSQVPVAPRSCPHCGAELAERAGECWLCKARLGDGAPVGAPSPPRTDGDQERTFSLSTLMLVFTGAGVCLCLCAAAPGLGIPVSVTLAPALMRAYAVAHQERVRGKPLTPGGKTAAFIRSFGIMLLVCFATLVSFVIAALTTCTAMGGAILDNDSAEVLIGVPSVVALGMFGLLIYAFWPKRGPKNDG